MMKISAGLLTALLYDVALTSAAPAKVSPNALAKKDLVENGVHTWVMARSYTGPKCNDWTNDNTFDINIANTKCYYDLGIGQTLKADPGSEPGQYCMYMYQLNDQGTCDCIIDHVAFEIKADTETSNCFPYPTGHKAYSFEKMPIEGCWKSGCYYAGELKTVSKKDGKPSLNWADPIQL